jgi:hypothetical protein
VVERQSEEDCNTATVAVAAKAIVEGGGVACRSSSDIVDDHRSTGKSWSNTSPNNYGGGGGGGEKNRHTTSSYWRQTVILPDYTDARGGVLDIVLALGALAALASASVQRLEGRR